MPVDKSGWQRPDNIQCERFLSGWNRHNPTWLQQRVKGSAESRALITAKSASVTHICSPRHRCTVNGKSRVVSLTAVKEEK